MPDEKPIDVKDPDHVDPILEEIWQIREEMAAEWNHDFDTMLRYFEEQRRVQPIKGLIDSLPNSA
jgi:Zn-dependent M32 family carboxypeptidase